MKSYFNALIHSSNGNFLKDPATTEAGEPVVTANTRDQEKPSSHLAPEDLKDSDFGDELMEEMKEVPENTEKRDSAVEGPIQDAEIPEVAEEMTEDGDILRQDLNLSDCDE